MSKERKQIENEPRMVIVEWADPERNKQDPDYPVCFGPCSEQAAEYIVTFIKAYQDADKDPPEDLFVCRIGTYKRPDGVRIFMAL